MTKRMHVRNIIKRGSYDIFLALEHRECQPCDEQILITRRKVSRPGNGKIFRFFAQGKGREIFFAGVAKSCAEVSKKGRAKPSLPESLRVWTILTGVGLWIFLQEAQKQQPSGTGGQVHFLTCWVR